MSAVVRDALGGVLADRPVTWSSSAPAVATVSASGTVTAVAAGTALISASVEGVTGSTTATVSALVSSVQVSPPTANLSVGGTQQLSATARDASGNTLTGRTVTWSTSNAAVATISGTGLVTAVAVGSATVTATVEGRSGTANATVNPFSGVRVERTQPGYARLTQGDLRLSAGTYRTSVSFLIPNLKDQFIGTAGDQLELSCSNGPGTGFGVHGEQYATSEGSASTLLRLTTNATCTFQIAFITRSVAVFTSVSLRAENSLVELLRNGSFTNGTTGWSTDPGVLTLLNSYPVWNR
jgi:hypothetical protein